jgi:hypothetical protein
MKQRRMVAVGLVAALVGGTGLIGLPARASSVPITFSTASSCNTCRTLVLQNGAGGALSSLDLSSGAAGFLAQVQDNQYLDHGFTVQATMSNLYQYNSATSQWNCANPVPSGDVYMASNQALLDANGLGSVFTPVWTLSGNISSVLSGLGLGLLNGVLPTGTPLTATGASQTLTQLQETGNALTDEIGSTLTSLTGLPLSLTGSNKTQFANPAAPPSGSGCTDTTGSNATPATILNGGLPATPVTPLINDLYSVISGVLGSTVSGTAPPTLAQLAGNSFLDGSTVVNEIAQSIGIPLNLLSAGVITSIEDDVTATLSSVLSTVDSLTGNYSASPNMTITTAGIPAGSYKGELTITLADT